MARCSMGAGGQGRRAAVQGRGAPAGVRTSPLAAAAPKLPMANPNLQLPMADAILLGTLMRGLTLGLRQGAIEAEEEDERRISAAHRTIRALDPSLRAALAHGLRLEAENPEKSLGTMLRDDSQEAPLSAVRQTMRAHDPAMLQKLASEIESHRVRGEEPNEPRLSAARRFAGSTQAQAMLQRGWGEATECADEAAEGRLSATHRTLRRMDPALRPALCRGMEAWRAWRGRGSPRPTRALSAVGRRCAAWTLRCGRRSGGFEGSSRSWRRRRRRRPALRRAPHAAAHGPCAARALARGWGRRRRGRRARRGRGQARRRGATAAPRARLRAAMAAMESGAAESLSGILDEEERPALGRAARGAAGRPRRAPCWRGIEEAGAAQRRRRRAISPPRTARCAAWTPLRRRRARLGGGGGGDAGRGGGGRQAIGGAARRQHPRPGCARMGSGSAGGMAGGGGAEGAGAVARGASVFDESLFATLEGTRTQEAGELAGAAEEVLVAGALREARQRQLGSRSSP